MLVAGDAGIGKSRLCRELRREAIARQVRVVEGRCSSGETAVPYAPFMDALRFRLARGEGEIAARVLGPLITDLSPLLPELRPAAESVPAAAAGGRPFESIHQALQRLAAMGPVLLLLEDIHWADLTSCDLLHFLSGRTRGDPVLLVATYRSDELPGGHPVRRLVATLKRERTATEILLPPLVEAEVAEMLQAITGCALPADFAGAVWHRTEGNPLFVEEILKSLGDSGRLGRAGLSAADLQGLELPDTISEAVLSRVEPLGPRSLELLSVAAVIGRSVTFDLLRDVTDLDEEELLRTLEALVAHHLLVEEHAVAEERYAFRHGLTQEVLYRNIIARRRRTWHRKVAVALEATPPAERAAHYAALAYHHRLGGDATQAREYEVLAGEQAARLKAWRDAEVHFDRALEGFIGGGPDPTEARVLEQLAEVTRWQNRTEDSVRYAEEALVIRRELGDRNGAATLLVRIGQLCSEQLGGWERAQRCHLEAIGLCGGESQTTARACGELGRVYAMRRRYAEAGRWLERGRELAARVSDRMEEALARAALGHLSVLRGRVREGLAELDGALEAGRAVPPPLERAGALYGTGLRACEIAGDARRLAEWLAAAEENGARFAASSDGAVYLAYRAAYHGRTAGVPGAMEAAQRAVDELRRARRAELGVALRILGDLQRIFGQRDAAHRAYSEALEAGERDAEIGLALLSLDEAPRAKAADLLLARVDRILADERLLALRILPRVVVAQVRSGRPDYAARTLDRLESLHRDASDPWGEAALAHAGGLVLMAEGDPARASQAFQAALAGWELVQAPLERAVSELELGALHCASASDRPAGIERCRAALAELERLGALAEAERARLLLRRVGVRVRRRRPRQDEDAAHGLTVRERQALLDLARGATNRQIATALGISEKTVAVHVSHILGKLRCRTRTQAAAFAIASGLAGPGRAHDVERAAAARAGTLEAATGVLKRMTRGAS